MSIVNVERLNETGEILLNYLRASSQGFVTAREVGRFAYAGHAIARQEAIKLEGRLADISAIKK